MMHEKNRLILKILFWRISSIHSRAQGFSCGGGVGQARLGPVLKKDTLLVKTLSGDSLIRRPSGSSILATVSINHGFQLLSAPRYFFRRRRNRSGSIGSTLALPRKPRCNSTPSELSYLTISTAHLGSLLKRLTELASTEPSNQMALSSQMNHIGAFLGDPSSATVARFAISGRLRTSSGSNGLGMNSPPLRRP